jgi:hypothetical protein
MTAPSAPPTPSAPAGADIDLQRLESGLAVVESLRQHLSPIGIDQARVDARVLDGTSAAVANLDVPSVLGLGALGHTAQITVESGSWRLTVRADGPALPSVESEGDPTSSTLSQAEISDLDAAVTASDAARALQSVDALPCTVHIEISNDAAAAGCHWIASVNDLQALLGSARWHATAAALGRGPRTLVITDLGTPPVATGGLLVRGPQASAVLTAPAALDDAGYRTTQSRDGRDPLPSPELFTWPTTDTSSPLAGLAHAFNGVARRLAWYWMAAGADIAPTGDATLTYSGARTVTFPLTPQSAVSVDDDLALYRWAATGNDPARQEALQHATSLAISSAADLASGAAPALRTARTLYELSRRTAISEALAASRSARDSALNAARQAADAARNTAGKTVERALLQVAAAVGVVLSNATNLLGRGPAAVLLVVLASLPIASLIIAREVELRSAADTLTAELKDLDQYRDVLASHDIAALRQINAVDSARRDLASARTTSLAVYLASAAAVLLVGGALVLIHTRPTSQSPATPTTSAPAVPAPTLTTLPGSPTLSTATPPGLTPAPTGTP